MPILLIGLTHRSRRQFLWLPQACKFLNDMRCKFMYIISERLHPRLQKHILPPGFWNLRIMQAGSFSSTFFTQRNLPIPEDFLTVGAFKQDRPDGQSLCIYPPDR